MSRSQSNSLPFTQYAYAGTDPDLDRAPTDRGELTFDKTGEWWLRWKTRLRKFNLHGDLTTHSFEVEALDEGSCRVSVVDRTGTQLCAFTLPTTSEADLDACVTAAKGAAALALAHQEDEPDAAGSELVPYEAKVPDTTPKKAPSRKVAQVEVKHPAPLPAPAPKAPTGWWSAPDAFKGLGWSKSVSIAKTSYLGGYGAHPRRHGNTNLLKIDAAGIHYRSIRELFAIGWDQIEDLVVEGPEQAEKRITATRIATIGVFALAAQKKSKTGVLTVALHSGEQAMFQTEAMTAVELRGKLAPVISKMRAAERGSGHANGAQAAPAAMAPIAPPPAVPMAKTVPVPAQESSASTPAAGQAGPVFIADELAKLADLRDRGILTDEEFAAQRRRLLEG